MKKYFLMDCHTVTDYIYEAEKNKDLPILTNMGIWLHCIFCHNCAEKQADLKLTREIMGTEFFPLSPDFEDILMEQLLTETSFEEKADVQAGFSFKGWVIIGFFMLFSLVSTFFGMNFIQIADREGLSFLLPIGLTIGAALTCYGALFIGSHLKELSGRFGLH